MKKEGLIGLIEAMSASEKRYFRTIANTHNKKESKALQLFELITKSKKYDEDRIIKTLDYQQNLNGFAVLKNYLFQLIIKSLRSHHSEKNIEIKLNEILLNVSILYNKKLYDISNKILDKGIKIADKYNYFGHLLVFYKWKIKIGQKGIFLGKNYYDSVRNILQQEIKILKSYKNSNFYQGVLQEYLMKTWEKDSLKQSTENHFPPLPEYLTDISHATTFKSRFYYHATRIEYFQYLKMIDEQLEESLCIINLFEANPQFIEKNADIYILTIGIVSILYLNKKEYDQLLIWRNRLINIKGVNSDSGIVKEQFILLNDLRLEIFVGNNEHEDIINRTDKFLSKKRWLPGIKDVYLIFNVIILLYKHKKYHEALSWQRKYEQKIKKPQIKFYTLRIQILELVIRYDMGEFRLLESLVNNTYNYMHRNGALNQVNLLLISFFKKLTKYQDKNQHKKYFAQLAIDIQSVQEQTQLYFIIQFIDFDFLTWAEERSK